MLRPLVATVHQTSEAVGRSELRRPKTLHQHMRLRE